MSANVDAPIDQLTPFSHSMHGKSTSTLAKNRAQGSRQGDLAVAPGHGSKNSVSKKLGSSSRAAKGLKVLKRASQSAALLDGTLPFTRGRGGGAVAAQPGKKFSEASGLLSSAHRKVTDGRPDGVCVLLEFSASLTTCAASNDDDLI